MFRTAELDMSAGCVTERVFTLCSFPSHGGCSSTECWKDKYWECCEFHGKGANGVLHCGGEIERGALFQKGRYRANVVSHVGQERAVVTKTAK